MVWCFLQNPTWTQQSFLEGLNFHWFPRGHVRIPTPKYLNYKMFWTNMPCEVGLGVFQSALMKNMLLNTLHGIHKSTCQLYRSISVFMSYRVLWCTLTLYRWTHVSNLKSLTMKLTRENQTLWNSRLSIPGCSDPQECLNNAYQAISIHFSPP
jgi:hypothetical protein